ncbi:hypothetical protein JMJ77_0011562, partial [Colletotrichum scovillei]
RNRLAPIAGGGELHLSASSISWSLYSVQSLPKVLR